MVGTLREWAGEKGALMGMDWSVVIPMFNGKPFIDETLATVLTAGCSQERIIIIDDASQDDSANHVLERYPRVTMVKHSTNRQGGLQSRLEGLNLVKTEAFLFLDQDDLLVPTGVKRQLGLLASDAEASAVVGDFDCFSVLEGGVRRYWKDRDRYWPTTVGLWSTAIFDVNVRMHNISCWMMRTEAARSATRTPTLGALTSQIVNQDWALVCVFAGQGRIVTSPDICMHYRVRINASEHVRPTPPPLIIQEFYGALKAFQTGIRGDKATRSFWQYRDALAVADARHANGQYLLAGMGYLKALILSVRASSGHTRRAAGVGFASSCRRLLLTR